MDKSYWLYQWTLSLSGHEQLHGRFPPFVFEESWYLAVRSAAIQLQQDLKPLEPISPEHIRMHRAELVPRWCVRHDQGSCELACESENEAQASIGQDNVETACGHYVHEVETVFLGLPDCELCLSRRLQLYAFEHLRKAPQQRVQELVEALRFLPTSYLAVPTDEELLLAEDLAQGALAGPEPRRRRPRRK